MPDKVKKFSVRFTFITEFENGLLVENTAAREVHNVHDVWDTSFEVTHPLLPDPDAEICDECKAEEKLKLS